MYFEIVVLNHVCWLGNLKRFFSVRLFESMKVNNFFLNVPFCKLPLTHELHKSPVSLIIFFLYRAWHELWKTHQKRMKGISLCVKSYFKWINILTDGGKERVRGREGSWWREKRIIVCFCTERVLFFGAAERQSLLSGVYQWDRSSEITHPDSRPQTCRRRLTQDYLPDLTWNCVDCQPQHWEICTIVGVCALCVISQKTCSGCIWSLSALRPRFVERETSQLHRSREGG